MARGTAYGVRRDGLWLHIRLSDPAEWVADPHMTATQRKWAETTAKRVNGDVVALCRGHYTMTATDRPGFDRLGTKRHVLADCPRDAPRVEEVPK